MKILHRYVLKEHAGPLSFALAALTCMLLLNTVSKRFGELAGKGLAWSVIGEFFALSIPFIIAMTLPMAVLVATLYAFSRLAADNEITALKASGVGLRRILLPVVAAASVVTLLMIVFNDQILPRTNHQLAVLQRSIAQKKPTFALREQVINELSAGELYLRAGHIDKNSNRMREITIYDFSDVGRRRTIHADSGDMAMSSDQSDLLMTLHTGTLQDIPTAEPYQLQRLFFLTDYVRVRGVGNQFREEQGETYKGEREMTVCEMYRSQRNAERDYTQALREFTTRMASARAERVEVSAAARGTSTKPPSRWSLGRAYCSLLRNMGVQTAAAQTGGTGRGLPLPNQRGRTAADTARGPALAAPIAYAPVDKAVIPAMVDAARIKVLESRRVLNLYEVEIHKKFALAVACIVFVLLGAPIALRFPRGGVGLTIGVSLGVFGLYYVALIGGQSLGSRGIVPPALAMWGANILFGGAGLALLARMGTESATSRGGDTRELLDAMRAWLARRAARVGLRRGAS